MSALGGSAALPTKRSNIQSRAPPDQKMHCLPQRALMEALTVCSQAWCEGQAPVSMR